MSNILDITLSILPVVIIIVMGVFLWYRRQLELDIRKYNSVRYSYSEDESKPNGIEKLILRGEVELRILEEITEINHNRYVFIGRGKSEREMVLEKIQRELREVLKNSIDNENFNEIKERVINLLDEIGKELIDIRQKIPFEGLDDPERSLLIDLVEEIDSSKEIPRQKAQQLADILKLKHQDIKKLQLENSKSASWTRWGTVGTVSFGLLSLALSIYTIYT